jgi:Mg-chelatase subunit ChlD
MAFVLVLVMVIIMVPTDFIPRAVAENTGNGYDVDGFKGAAPNLLICPNRETTVTLSLPSAEYQNAIDIVFAMDSSTSTQNSTVFTESVNDLFESIIENNPNIKLKVGVIRFRGRAHDAIDYLSNGAYSGLTLYSDESKTYIERALNMSKAEVEAAFGRGSSTHGGIDIADEWLAADREVNDDHKYLVLLTDGKTYVWNNENNEPTTIYSQYYAGGGSYGRWKMQNDGVPALSQSACQFKDSYPVDVLDMSGHSNIFWFNDYQALYDCNSAELSGVSPWDAYCSYAVDGSTPTGSVEKHIVTNGADLFGSNSATYGNKIDYQYYFEYTPDEAWKDVPYLEGNPFAVIENDDGTYTFDTQTINPNYYMYHVDCLTKGMYMAGHLWSDVNEKYNCAVVTYSGGGATGFVALRASFISWLQANSKYGANIADSSQVQQMFSDIDNSIQYMVASGVVTDIIGDDFSLINTGSADCFRMTFNGEALPVTFANGVWSFGTADGEGTYPYTVEYTAATKTITWTINVPVENTKPITLSYDLTLPEDAVSGNYDTNKSAVLDYKSTDGKRDGTYVFEVPQVTYICPGNNPPSNFDVDGSKVASPTLLVCPNRETTVTLSLPSAEYQNAIDIVFAMDSSTSAENSTVFTESVNALFASIIENNPNIVLKVGVIRFRGRAHDAIKYLSDNAYSGLTVYNDASKTYIEQALNMSEDDIKAAFGSGSNTHGGIDIANEWLKADTEVDDDHKYLVLLTDGKTYIWNDDNHEPTTIYAQWYRSNSYTMQNSGKPALNQVIGYNKYDYPVDVLDPTGKSNIFVFRTIEALLASDSTELTGVSPWDEFCRYADTKAVPNGTVVKHDVTNGNDLFGSNSATYGKRGDYKSWYEFTPNSDWTGVKYLEANPFMVIDNGDGTYTFDTENINPNYYQYHVDPLQKGIYKAAKLWEQVNRKYNCAVITYDGGSTDGGLQLRLPFNAWLRGNSKYGAGIANSSEVQEMFSDIDNNIRYMVSKGVVVDKIGDDFSLANTDSENCFRMTLSGQALPVTFANGIWSFGTPDAEGIYPYAVAYDAENKNILWTINVPVENAKPITLSYDLTLRSDAPTGFYDTNEWAILNYKSSDGKKDGTYVFEIPEINFICPGNNPPSEFDVDGSKVASPTELACPNRQTTVTLSLPSAEYKPAYDVVFVMDSSTSTQNNNIDFSEIVLKLLDGAKEKNIDLKVGVIKTRGIAFDIISLVTEGEHEKLVEYSDDTKKAIIDSINVPGWALFVYSHSSGTNMHGALKMADEWLTADTTVSNDHKFVFFLTDGKTYIWNNENNEPTSVYGQYMARGTAYPIPAVGQQTIAYSKSAYKYTDNQGFYNKADANDLADLTFDEYFAKTHNFYTNDFAKLYASTNAELSGPTKYDYFCRYAANNGDPAADGTVIEHAVSNGNFGYILHKNYYEFIPDENFADLNWLQANPYTVEESEGVYTYTTTPNPDFYQLHPDGLQKALYLTGHLWTDMVAKYNGAAIVYSGWGGGSGLEIAQSFNNWIKSDGISDYAADFVDADSILSIFDEIKDDILYMIASGVVADVIGDDFSLLNTDKATCFRMTLNGTDLQVTFENDVWSFGTPDEEGKYPYEVKYDDDRKMIIWTINVPVEIAKPVTLSYDLELREDAETDFYDTNEWAILNYKSTDGTHDGSYVFDVPVVSYIACIEVNVEKIWDDSNNRYNTRPDSVTVVLTDGEGHEWTLELKESGEWKGTFGHVSNMHIPDSKLVEVEDENGEVVGSFVPITYSLKELEVYGYECEITGDTDVGFTITNTRLTPDLTITKTVTDEADCARVFLFKVTGVNDFEQIICIVGNGSVTLKDMLFGKYNVTELTDWSYDYDIVGDASREADLTTGDKTVTFANKADDTNWLRAEAYADNWVRPNPVQ